MKLIPAINLVRYCTSIAILAYFVSFIGIIVNIGNMERLFVALSLALVSTVLLLIGKYGAKFLMPRMRYKGVFYGVCNNYATLGYEPDDSVLDDLYKPQYDTATFLADNNLPTDIYLLAVGDQKTRNLILVGCPVLLLLLLGFLHLLPSDAWVMVAAIGAATVSYLVSSRFLKKPQPGAQPVYSFSPAGLSVSGQLLPWDKVYGWNFVAPKEQKGQHLDIDLTTPVARKHGYRIPVSGTTATLTIVYVLLHHYKNKYGYTGS